MTWPANIRAQVLRDQREAAKRRGALTPDAPAPPLVTIADVVRERRRVIEKEREREMIRISIKGATKEYGTHLAHLLAEELCIRGNREGSITSACGDEPERYVVVGPSKAPNFRIELEWSERRQSSKRQTRIVRPAKARPE